MLKKYSTSTAQTCWESSLRGMDHQQSHMFSSLSPEARVRRIIADALRLTASWAPAAIPALKSVQRPGLW
jgi:hypothetical protein